MGFQFVHFEGYSRSGDKDGRSVDFILGEAERRPDASVHVTSPAPPQRVWGLSLSEVRAQHDARADAARDVMANGRSRAIRKTQKTLATVVASYSVPLAEVRNDPEKTKALTDWEKRTVAWLRETYGDQLVGVVRHVDETYPHLHAYILPDNRMMKVSDIHPGQVAKGEVMSAGHLPGEDAKALNKRGDAAYRAAMRDWQASYHQTVGIPCGLTRLGPLKRRLTRAQWQAEQTQARALQASLDRAAKVQQKVDAFVREQQTETESLVAQAETIAAALQAEAAAAKADAARRLAEAEIATEAAKAAHDAAVAEQRKASWMMARVREADAKMREATARLQHWPSRLRTAWDGLRNSKVAERIRAAVESEMTALRERASSALARAAAADAALRKAEVRASSIDHALTETTTQRDLAREELARLRPPEPMPRPSLGPGMRPMPRRR
ncbi:hypothetical protein ELH44_22295 [Rhizobium ruizarguesonis]|uniref:plasmid recombination protein n=1 Tax=Rhizobium ruizarguesonis TaxID=2081791 RepID=UPI0010311CDA|nr:plasmid recombination protein [Rhizobium ruizarguesonis]TBB56258.1 hypothetical protein ELH44_22295 [Rhizobium ruizarguesonis]